MASRLIRVAATVPWRYGRVMKLVRREEIQSRPAEQLIRQVCAYQRLRRAKELGQH